MKINLSIPSDAHSEAIYLQRRLGLQSIEKTTLHAWRVLHFLLQKGPGTISSSDMQWIAHPGRPQASLEPGEHPAEAHEPEKIPHTAIDTHILNEIHRLLDDECIDEAIKASQIYKLLTSNAHGRKGTVDSEMLLSAAETFANESDPETATHLIMETGHKTSRVEPPSE